jgi:hypothetical protein
LNNISKIKGNIKAISLLEKADDVSLFLAGDSASVSGFSKKTHELIDLWSVILIFKY